MSANAERLIRERLNASRDAPECGGCRHRYIDKDGDHVCLASAMSGQVFGDNGTYHAFCVDMRQAAMRCGPTGNLFQALDS